MRALSACLTVVLGLGVAAIAACSSTASDTGSGGTGGTSAGGTSAGGTSAGGTSSAGTHAGGTSSAGTGGAIGAAGDQGAGGDTCSFDSPDCAACIATKCPTEFGACGNDNMCSAALSSLQPCLCNSSSTAAECTTKFKTDGGTAAGDLSTCFDANCKSSCE